MAIAFLLIAAGSLLPIGPAWADSPRPPASGPSVLDKAVPETIAELKALQSQVKKVLDKVIPCTVGVRIGSSQGSGVIIDKEGHVLTAGHVSGQPDRDVIVVLASGKTVKGKTLGANRGIDSGLIRITDKGDWPHLEMGKSIDLKPGQWCIATGHPGGYRPGRTPVVRLGRVLRADGSYIQTDCTLVGGDSGGPLFDLQGQVIGIHSRIGGPITANVHVPVDTYRDTWDRLAKGEVWGGLPRRNPNDPFVGVQGDPEGKECKILQVVPGSPAEKAGIKADDVVTKFDGKKIANFAELGDLIRKKKPGDEVPVELVRGEEKVTIKLTIGKRGNS